MHSEAAQHALWALECIGHRSRHGRSSNAAVSPPTLRPLGPDHETPSGVWCGGASEGRGRHTRYVYLKCAQLGGLDETKVKTDVSGGGAPSAVTRTLTTRQERTAASNTQR